MRISRTVSVLSFFSAALLICLAPAPSRVASRRSSASPLLKMGPRAVPANVAGPTYGLFTCQLGLAPGVVCYDPYQMRHAYGTDTLINGGFDGRGKTIVIIDAFQYPGLIADLKYFNSFYGLPGLNGLGDPPKSNLGTFTQIAPDGLGKTDPSWAGEITLDVLWAHAIAPGANIALVLAKSNSDADILSATKYAVDHNLGDIISQSFGENESCMDPAILAQQHQVFADATRKNITIFASSGDQGAAQGTCDGKSWTKAVSSPASDPLVTAVGGTELHAADYCLKSLGCDPTSNPAAGTYLAEFAWNEFNSESTGGGFSIVNDEPAYQQGTISGGKQRGLADVSYNAAIYHGVLARFQNTWYLFGGTSAGSPQWAAIVAIADQEAARNLGFINSGLYRIGQSKSHYAVSFFDVVSGTNSVVEPDSSNNPISVAGFNAGPGWDAPTGLGSPKTNLITDYLIQLVYPGDGISAIADSKPHPVGKPSASGQLRPY